jgi:hypothetical protein
VCGGVPSAGRLLFGGKAGTSAPLHLIGKLAHGFLRDEAPFSTSKRGFRLIDGGEDFRTGALAFLPERKGFLHCVFLAPEPSALDGLTNKRFLVGCELHFHTP